MKANTMAQIGLVLVSILLLFNSSCSLIQSSSQQENESVEDSGAEEQPAGNEQPASVAAEEDEGELLGCFDVQGLTLSVDHTLTVNEAETSLTHILNHGGIGLLVSTDTEQGDTAITTAAPQTLTYEYMGVVGPCEVEAEGETILSAQGYCEEGIIYLTITEDWQATSGTMTCDGEVVNFPIPAYSAVHSGEFGKGEEFLITSDQAGFTIMRPFLGGEGYHSWTLAYDIGLVPLVPEDD